MSDRGFSSTIETELSAAEANLAFLVFLDFPGDPVYVWTGIGDISYDGETWAGAGEFGSIDKIGDSLEAADIGVELTLNFLDDAIRDEIVLNDPIGQDASIYLAVMSGSAVVDAYEIFPGFIDSVEIEDAGETGSIKVRVASELARLDRPTRYFLTDATQQKLFPGDVGMEYAARMDQPIRWGDGQSAVVFVSNNNEQVIIGRSGRVGGTY